MTPLHVSLQSAAALREWATAQLEHARANLEQAADPRMIARLQGRASVFRQILTATDPNRS